jgi:hypothetical protein
MQRWHDLRVLAFRCQAWLDTVLKRAGDPALEAYLNQRLNAIQIEQAQDVTATSQWVFETLTG